MSSFYMLGRLLWRPAGGLMLLTVAMLAFVAGVDLAQRPEDLVGAALDGEAARDLRLALWPLATLVPAIAGSLLSFSARELQHTFFAWTLPGLSAGLRTGKAVFGVAGAILLALLAARTQAPGIAAAVFGWALLCFALGGVAFDPVLSKTESRGVPVILVLLVFRPGYLDQVILLQPLLLGALSMLASGVVLHREFSTALSRERPLFGVSPTWATTPHGTRQFWSRSSAPAREWNETLAKGRFFDWLRAGCYEAYGGVRRGWAGIGLVQIAIAMTAAHFTDSPQLVLVMGLVVLFNARTQLRAKFLYPVSRTQRAALFLASTVLETFVIAMVALTAVTVLFVLAPPDNALPWTDTLGGMASLFVFFVVWAPVGHWAKIREPWTGENPSVRLALRFWGFQIAYLILAILSFVQFRRLTPASSLSWVAAGIFAAGIYAIYWLAVRRHFRTSDLVFARA